MVPCDLPQDSAQATNVFTPGAASTQARDGRVCVSVCEPRNEPQEVSHLAQELCLDGVQGLRRTLEIETEVRGRGALVASASEHVEPRVLQRLLGSDASGWVKRQHLLQHIQALDEWRGIPVLQHSANRPSKTTPTSTTEGTEWKREIADDAKLQAPGNHSTE